MMTNTSTRAAFARFSAPHTFALAMTGRQDAVELLSRPVASAACPSRFYYPAHQAGGGAWTRVRA